MAETMSPSKATAVTTGQIGKLQEMFGAGLRKAEPELPSDAVQQAMEKQGDALVSDLVNAVRKHAEIFANTIVRHVRVNRTQTSREAVVATGRVQYTDSEVVAEMPIGEGEEVDVHFFPLRRFTSVEDFQRALDERGLVPNPRAVAKVNEDDPQFADTHPNGTQWLDSRGRHCYFACRRWDGGERGVSVRRCESDWSDYWWAAGVPRK